MPEFRFEGLFCNAVDLWGESLLRAPVVMRGRPVSALGGGMCEIVESGHDLLGRSLHETWPVDVVLGDRDPRQRTG